VICSYFLVLLSILYELQLSYGLIRKDSEESITVIHPAGDKSIMATCQCHFIEETLHLRTYFKPKPEMNEPEVKEM